MREQWKNIVGAISIAVLLTLGITTFGKTAISDVAGLAVAQTTALWNNVRDAAVGDNITNGILATSVYMYNGTAFDRVRGDTTNGLDVDVTRMPGGAQTPADGTANPTTFQGAWSLNGLFNGTTWDRAKSISAANNTATTSIGTAYVTQLATWTLTNDPGSAAQATVTKAAGGGTVRHVATMVSGCLQTGSAVGGGLTLQLRDGASGVGPLLASWRGVATQNSGAASAQCVNITGLNITGSANTAMTLEFNGATAANQFASVVISGYSTP